MRLNCYLQNGDNFVSAPNVLILGYSAVLNMQNVSLLFLKYLLFSKENNISHTKTFPHAWPRWQFSHSEVIP